MNKIKYIVFIFSALFFSQPMLASDKMHEKLVNTSHSNVEDLTQTERVLVDFTNRHGIGVLNGNRSEYAEEICIQGEKYRLSCVPGDMDCGIHSINAQYPHLKLTRAVLIGQLLNVLLNPDHPLLAQVRRELSYDIIFTLKNELLRVYPEGKANVRRDEIEGVLLRLNLPYYTQMEAHLDTIHSLSRDLYADHNPFVELVQNDLNILFAYLQHLQDPNVLLLAVPQDDKYIGTFGLVCSLYNLNIRVFNYAHRGDMPAWDFINKANAPVYSVLFRGDHFSPLCRMDNIVERQRLAAHHIRTFLLPLQFVYRGIKFKDRERRYLQAAIDENVENFVGLPEDFDGRIYVRMYEDLLGALAKSGLDESAFGAFHYKKYGKAEKRAYRPNLPADFDPQTYVRLHGDLRAAQAESDLDESAFGILHYMKHGKNEGRQYRQDLPEDFDGLVYLGLHGDLRTAQAASGLDETAYAAWHYKTYGKDEGRLYK